MSFFGCMFGPKLYKAYRTEERVNVSSGTKVNKARLRMIRLPDPLIHSSFAAAAEWSL